MRVINEAEILGMNNTELDDYRTLAAESVVFGKENGLEIPKDHISEFQAAGVGNGQFVKVDFFFLPPEAAGLGEEALGFIKLSRIIVFDSEEEFNSHDEINDEDFDFDLINSEFDPLAKDEPTTQIVPSPSKEDWDEFLKED